MSWIPTAITSAGWLTASGAARYYWRQTRTDALTGLGNRARLADVVGRTARRHPRRLCGRLVGVLLLDVDNFKHVNDTHGHRAGDHLLAALADRLRRIAAHHEIPVRLHGDEFVVWLGHVTSVGQAKRRGRELAAALAPPVVVDGHRLAVTVSVGAAIDHALGCDLGRMLRQADQRMYTAKRHRHHITRVPTPHVSAARLRDRRKVSA